MLKVFNCAGAFKTKYKELLWGIFLKHFLGWGSVGILLCKHVREYFKNSSYSEIG